MVSNGILTASISVTQTQPTQTENKVEAYISWNIDQEIKIDEDGDETEGDEYVLIEKIWIPVAERGKGKGSEMLKQALEEIREQHPCKVIKVAALPFDDGMEMEELCKWYEKFGFMVDNCDGHAVIMSI